MALACLDLTFVERLCAHCASREGGLKRCPCGSVHYCDSKCQRQDRPVHKSLCKMILSGQVTTRNPKAYKQNTSLSQIFHHVPGLGMQIDAHAWHELDAQDTDNPSCAVGFIEYKGLSLHVPFSDKLQRRVIRHSHYGEKKARWLCKINACVRDDLFDEQCTNAVLEQYKTFGTGFDRAWYLMLRWPDVYNDETLRIGSLGYHTKGGGVFWELG